MVDTGATKTIVKKSIVGNSKKLLKSRWQLRTATGDAAKVHGEADAVIKFGATTFTHRVLVADIEESVILGMDVMSAHGFRLDLKKHTLEVGTEELILHPQKDICAQLVLTEDVTLPERSELLTAAQIEGTAEEGAVAMIEPRNEDLENIY